MQRALIPRCLGVANRGFSHIKFPISRPFSISLPRRANTLMETSGFSDTQLEVREAISKICTNFPDVRPLYYFLKNNIFCLVLSMHSGSC
jgi:acyl-CoA dehydrogenase